MVENKTIYIICADDAPEHLGNLKQILENLKQEERITDTKELSSDTFDKNSLSEVDKGDMILFILTKAIAPVKTAIEETLLKLKQKQPGTKIAEIIVDNLTFETEFIAFPEDLEPIRSREDMDAVWAQIGNTLRDMFPAEKKPHPVVNPTNWSKYLKIAGVLLVLLVAFFIIKGITGGSENHNALLFKNTVWTGDYNLTGQLIQPVSIAFNENGSFVWYHLSGELLGSWMLEEDKLIVNFSNGSSFKAKITDNNKLTNIEIPAEFGWTLNNAELNTVPEDVLDNTNWKTENLLIHFLEDNKVEMTLGSSRTRNYEAISYIRKAKFVRFTYPNYNFFLVRTSSFVFKGINQPEGDPVIYPFQVTKQ